jgi:hypothetical protein
MYSHQPGGCKDSSCPPAVQPTVNVSAHRLESSVMVAADLLLFSAERRRSREGNGRTRASLLPELTSVVAPAEFVNDSVMSALQAPHASTAAPPCLRPGRLSRRVDPSAPAKAAPAPAWRKSIFMPDVIL